MVLVRFRWAGSAWGVPVDHVVGVRAAGPVRPLPVPRPGVAGVVEHDGEAVPVAGAAGGGGAHVLLLDVGGGPFALLVERVEGLVDVGPQLGPAPAGQEVDVVTGTAALDGGVLLVVDAARLAEAVGR